MRRSANESCSPLRTSCSSSPSTPSLQETCQWIPKAPILSPEGPWETLPSGGVCSPLGFSAFGTHAGLRASGKKADLSLVLCEKEAVVAGTFTQNVMCAAPVEYCKRAMGESETARAVLTNAGQANAATGDLGYQDTVECASALANLLGVPSTSVLIQSTGVIGQRIKKDALVSALPLMVTSLGKSEDHGLSAAVAITTTDLVSKSSALRVKLPSANGSEECFVTIGGMSKGSGMICPNMATMLGVFTCDAVVSPSVWKEMVRNAVKRSFNQITVDGDTSTNDCVIALASGLAGNEPITDPDSESANKLQSALDALFRGLAKAIAWDGEGATCLVEVSVSGAENEESASTVAKAVANSSLAKAAIYGRDPNWGRIACAAGYSGVKFNPNLLKIELGTFLLMENGQPLPFDRAGASAYLKAKGEAHATVNINISIGSGSGEAKAWGCDLSYDYVKINAEYTT